MFNRDNCVSSSLLPDDKKDHGRGRGSEKMGKGKSSATPQHASIQSRVRFETRFEKLSDCLCNDERGKCYNIQLLYYKI